MNKLPITHMTLYKNGVGFFERRARMNGEAVTFSFRTEEMNDVLKSLTAIDWGPGQVLGVEYATPQSQEERLVGCSVSLATDRSLRDLLRSLRGRHIQLLLDQEETLTGTLVGLDEAPVEQPLSSALVSLLLDGTDEIRVVTLGRLQGIQVLDEQAIADLRFFLQASLTQERYREVTIRLTPGEHDLSVSYIAPAPTWRVSYRLAADPAENGSQGKALLQGWGIFDNQLEEDLTNISLSLVAGMPISFVYDLYTPFTPERPRVSEQKRVAPGPIEFDQGVAVQKATLKAERARTVGVLATAAPMAAREGEVRRQELEHMPHVDARGEELGQLFEYVIGTPVTVGRGQSAMVPIVSANLSYRKDLLYNAQRMPRHPVATLRLKNNTGLTLERGPLTVLEGGEYVGEAIMPLTAANGQIVIPYAVELGATIREEAGARREIHSLGIKGYYLIVKEWDVRWRDYQLTNRTGNPLTVLIEHPRTRHYELFDSPKPREQTEQHWRFEISVPAFGEETLRVQERRLVRRREELRRQSMTAVQGYLEQGVLSRRDYDLLVELLALWERIASLEKRLEKIERERGQVYRAQEQIRENMQALSTTGKEGALRASYVEKLRTSEKTLQALADNEAAARAELTQLQEEIEALLQASTAKAAGP